jgi:hypothetical protein
MIENDIHADARESAARRVFRLLTKEERPDIAVAIILQALDIWYEKGYCLGVQSVKENE